MFLSVLEAYPQAETEQQKALAEARLWALAAPSEKAQALRRSVWLVSILPGNVMGVFELRQRLLGAPQTLWDHIHTKKIGLRTAVDLWRDAEHRALAEGGDAVQILAELLTKHDSLPNTRIVNGHIVKVRSKVSHFREPPGKRGRGIWVALRQAIGSIVKHKADRLKIAELEQQELFNWLEREIMSVIDSFDNRVGRFRQGKVEVTRRQVLQACHVLHVEPPSPGEAVDIGAAKKNYRRLLHEYHPDKSRAENAAVLYQAVIEAFDTIEQYNKNRS
jgi:hypothetical protein